MRSGIESEQYTYSDILRLIKLLKYKRKYDRQEHIYYDKFGDEVEQDEDYIQYGVIQSVEDSVFNMKFYFKDDTPNYEGRFTSFYPHRKKGDFL